MIQTTQQHIELGERKCLSIYYKDRDKDREFHITLTPFRCEGRLCIAWRTKKERTTETTIYGLNRFPAWWHQLKWNLTYLYLKLGKKLRWQCHGCGEGIIKWKIKDPNKPRVSLFVCDGCVIFYDIWFSRQELDRGNIENVE